MPVTELALLRILHASQSQSQPPDTTLPPTLLTHLQKAAVAQATFSKHPVAIYQCIEDRSLIYLIGGWSSVEVHMNVWIPSDKNQELLGLLGGDLAVEWVLHVELDPGKVFTDDIASVTAEEAGGVLAFERCFVKAGGKRREEFGGVWEGSRRVLKEGLGGRDRAAAGWRVDKEMREDGMDREELVVFSAWESVDRHLAFKDSGGFGDYDRIVEYLDGMEARHGKGIIVAVPGEESD